MEPLIIIQAVSVIQFLVVGVFLITLKKGNRAANISLASFLILKAICYSGEILTGYRYFIENLPFLFVITTSVDFLLGPSLFFYTTALMYKEFKFQRKHLWHVLLFLLYLVYFSIVFFIYHAEGLNFLYGRTYHNLISTSVMHFQFIVYSVLCLVLIKKYQRELKSEYSSIDKIKMSWLFFLISGFIIIWSAANLNFLFSFFSASILLPWELLITFIFIFANAIVYKGLQQPELFSGFPEREPVQKYAKTSLHDKKKDEYLERILAFMEEEKPYLNPTITLNEFADKICIPAHYISQILNTSLNQNFFDFINSRRIEESKLNIKNNSGNTILEILYDAGFNSKASFNRAFKKHTGMTPSEYKKTCLDS